MSKFTLAEEYMTSVIVKYGYTSDNGTFIESTSHVDHPSFTALRECLGHTGYIEIERMWWNGDRVTAPFTLNDKQYSIGDKFSSAGAMGCSVKFERKYNVSAL
jgi:hypothetical protein